LLFSLEDYQQSEVALKKALELYPDLVAPYLYLAKLYQIKGNTDKVIAQYKMILERRPRFVRAYMEMGTIYEAEGRKADASAMYEKALELDPGFAPAANNLAWMLLQKNEDLHRALDLVKRAKKQLPDDPNVSDTFGLAIIRLGLYASAVTELSEAVKKLPDNPTVLYHLALAHWKNGEKDKAIEVLKRALETDQEFKERKQAEKLQEEIQTEAA
jgi:tetratricopeptide (TPR) repeat protein